MKNWLFGKEPALLIGFVSALLTVGVALGLRGLGSGTVGLIIAALTALLGAFQAVYTRPWQPAAFTTLVAAVAALAAGYGWHVSPELIGAVDGLVLAALSLLTRAQVSPTLALAAANKLRRSEAEMDAQVAQHRAGSH